MNGYEYDESASSRFLLTGSAGYPPNRLFAWNATRDCVAPAAGADVDGAIMTQPGPAAINAGAVPAIPGLPVRIEAAAAFAAGTLLETTSNGRVQTVAAGKAVLRALDAAAGAGSIVWAVFTSGR